ncbi:MAG: helix-turn-helix domain-containing protein [Eubacterium sp.]|nr:helix-turn-helix domain-containing protein [Eubacterium sp.]
MSIVNERIKERRKQLNITLLELAEFVGVKEATMQRYESGEIKSIPYDNIVLISEYLKCTPQYLLGWVDEISPDMHLSEHEKELVQAYRNRPDRQDSVDALLQIGKYKEYYIAANSTDNQKHTKISLSDENVNKLKRTKESDIDC